MADDTTSRKPLFRLIADLPRLLVDQAKNELEQFKLEMVAKLKHAGIGVGLFAGAAFLGFFLFAVLLTAAILGFATFLPGWLSALIVAFILLVIIVVLVLVGLRQVKKGLPPVPEETVASVKKDVNTIKGIGKRPTS